MYFELKENRPHGTPENPFSQYHISDVKRAFQIPVHWHDELEIIYVKHGKLHVTISGENYIGNPKEAFVVSPGSLHFMGSPTGDVDYYTFLFPVEYISFQTDDIMEKTILSPLKHGRAMIKPQINDMAEDICERLIEINTNISYLKKKTSESTEERKNRENHKYNKSDDIAVSNTNEANINAQFETKMTLIKFIQKMWQNGLILENAANGTNTTEKEMITYIRQNYTREISLQEFGMQFHLSEKYISRYFKEHFHITLSQYINHLRLEHARQLLQESTVPVTEVALQSGYQNVSYFIRCFKKMYGVSPLKYRKGT
ncbi:MAG: AraC family transcriptional regulator [[Eubacterium] rectale]|nr:AraC family transcriptional regulator [Agathobacter rectalis]